MSPSPLQKITPVALSNVTIADRFWAPRIKTNRERTLRAIYKKFKESGHLDAFKLDWKHGDKNEPHKFWDSDVAKWIEAASHSVAVQPDKALETLLEEVVELVCAAQQRDGYLNTYFTTVKAGKRWTNMRDDHELYCAGHLIEAAVAHFEATGKRTLLECACRYADLIDRSFGVEVGKRRGYCGHEEIELALVKLFRATKEKRYLKLSRYFVDERGKKPHYFDFEARERGENPAAFRHNSYSYNQSHAPVREQSEITGHAVRALYLYSGMADLAGELSDASLHAACERIWKHLCERNLYLTGGVGTSHQNEGLTFDYDLPNESAYSETCAAVGLVLWSHRLLQLDCDSRYSDVMERALYNGVISGVSLSGDKFFYENPLASMGAHHRQEWFSCACCPPNLARTLASMSRYIYSSSDNEAIIHLYVQGSGVLNLGGRPVKISVETDYPWDGKVVIKVDPEKKSAFRLKFRLPGWCRDSKVSFGSVVSVSTQKGYMQIDREWEPGDKLEVNFGMPIERIYAHPRVRQTCGRMALQRGPLVYCLEGADNGGDLNALALHPAVKLQSKFEEELLGGAVSISGEAMRSIDAGWEGLLYRPLRSASKPVEFKAIPYCMWDNRNPGEMLIWLRHV